MLITGCMRMYAYAKNVLTTNACVCFCYYASAYILEFSRRRIQSWSVALMLLLITGCNVSKKTYLLQNCYNFSSKFSKRDCQWNITTTWFARFYRILSAKSFTNLLKFDHLCLLVPVHRCNLAFSLSNQKIRINS